MNRDDVVEALEFYAKHGENCRKLGGIPEGDASRDALSQDGGKRATAALASLPQAQPEEGLVEFEPQHLLGLAYLFRSWGHAEMWGDPEQAELAARQVETAAERLTAPSRNHDDEPTHEMIEAGYEAMRHGSSPKTIYEAMRAALKGDSK